MLNTYKEAEALRRAQERIRLKNELQERKQSKYSDSKGSLNTNSSHNNIKVNKAAGSFTKNSRNIKNSGIWANNTNVSNSFTYYKSSQKQFQNKANKNKNLNSDLFQFLKVFNNLMVLECEINKK